MKGAVLKSKKLFIVVKIYIYKKGKKLYERTNKL